MPFTKWLRSSMKIYLKISSFLAKTLKNVHQEAKSRLCQYYETPVEGPFCRPLAFQWIYLLLLSSVPFFSEWTKPRRRWLRWQVSQFQLGMTEKSILRRPLVEQTFSSGTRSRPADLWNSKCHSGHGSLLFVEGKLKLLAIHKAHPYQHHSPWWGTGYYDPCLYPRVKRKSWARSASEWVEQLAEQFPPQAGLEAGSLPLLIWSIWQTVDLIMQVTMPRKSFSRCRFQKVPVFARWNP